MNLNDKSVKIAGKTYTILWHARAANNGEFIKNTMSL